MGGTRAGSRSGPGGWHPASRVAAALRALGGQVRHESGRFIVPHLPPLMIQNVASCRYRSVTLLADTPGYFLGRTVRLCRTSETSSPPTCGASVRSAGGRKSSSRRVWAGNARGLVISNPGAGPSRRQICPRFVAPSTFHFRN